MKVGRMLRFPACAVGLSLFLAGCILLPAVGPAASISAFDAAPASGPAPLPVDFHWQASGDPNGFPPLCSLYIVPPGTFQPEAVHQGECNDARFSRSFATEGVYEAVLVLHTQNRREAQATFADHQANGVTERWLEEAPLRRSLTFEVLPAGAAADPPAAAPAGERWELVETDDNPYDLSVQADMFAENAAYAGSFKECIVNATAISYQHVVAYNGDYLANVLFSYFIEQPPPSAAPGETVTLTHALQVNGEVLAGGGNTPAGRAGYDAGFWASRVLSVASAALNDAQYPAADSEEVTFTFPTTGNVFTLEAGVYDTQTPDIACDIAWTYQR